MSNQLDPWEEKMQAKLGEFRLDAEPTDAKVSSFFDQMDEKQTGKSNYPTLAIAASVILVLVAGLVVFRVNQVEIVTDNTMAKHQIYLPDNSRVMMRHNSTLSYNTFLWKFSRSVSLEGEAYFEVAKGEKFSVESSRGTTSVLGTAFNIFSTEEEYKVKCFEGKVAVNTGSGLFSIGPGQSVLNKKGALIEESFDLADTSWHKEELIFEEASLAYVFDRLGKVYNKEFIVPEEVLAEKYTGFFPADDLSLALRLVLEPLDLKAEFGEENKVIISKIEN